MSDAKPSAETIPRPEFLSRAQACVRFANAATTESLKTGWLEVAEVWLRLALPAKTAAQTDFQTELDAKYTGQRNSDSMN